jgi:hypothetical protein
MVERLLRRIRKKLGQPFRRKKRGPLRRRAGGAPPARTRSRGVFREPHLQFFLEILRKICINPAQMIHVVIRKWQETLGSKSRSQYQSRAREPRYTPSKSWRWGTLFLSRCRMASKPTHICGTRSPRRRENSRSNLSQGASRVASGFGEWPRSELPRGSTPPLAGCYTTCSAAALSRLSTGSRGVTTSNRRADGGCSCPPRGRHLRAIFPEDFPVQFLCGMVRRW